MGKQLLVKAKILLIEREQARVILPESNADAHEASNELFELLRVSLHLQQQTLVGTDAQLG